MYQFKSGGADPEFFLKKDGIIVPAIGKLGGTKDAPLMIGDVGIQEDNVMAEINVPVSRSEDEFVENVKRSIQTLSSHAKGFEVVIQPHAMFPLEEMQNKQAQEIGCSPDWGFDPTSGFSKLLPPTLPETTRFVGGHFHTGVEGVKGFDDNIILSAAHAITMSLPAYHLDNNQRREFYGQPGRMRPKPYGIEYRALSNFWTADEKYMRWIWQAAVSAVDIANVLTKQLALDALSDIHWAITNDDEWEINALASQYNVKML